MTWSMLREIDRSGLVTVASQTVTHPADLRMMEGPTIRREFRASAARLVEHLGHPCAYLAYPNGFFDDRCQAIARECGYRMAFGEVTQPFETSPGRYAIHRYVHTKWRAAWADANPFSRR
jgi:peptidoglycan/xylan/chitin deacetylase (PgdA/CDA1 family)